MQTKSLKLLYKKTLNVFLVFAYLTLFIACRKQDQATIEDATVKNVAPTGFIYSTTRSVELNVQLLSNLNEPLKRIPVSFYNAGDSTELNVMLTNDEGRINSKIELPSYITQVTVKPHSVGLAQDLKVRINQNKLSIVIGGKDGLIGDVVRTKSVTSQNVRSTLTSGSSRTLNTNFIYLGGYNPAGKPNYLTPQKGAVSADLLGFLNYSLPEGKDIVSHHLVYLSPAANRDMDVVKTSEIFITYVSEGAIFKDPIGYYTYPTGHKPNTINDISEIKYLFPNASGVGSGGDLVSGDRISLGNILAGTSIGFVLFSDGWDEYSQIITKKNDYFFSDESLNPESDHGKKQHSVLLNYEKEDLVVIGFEDVNRESGKSDDDFNDVVLYLSSANKNAISKTNIVKLVAPIDSDGDGVSDDNDAYPGDSKKAYNVYYPSQNGWGTLAFEDNWPKTGDYDMNDLVVSYRYAYAVNANNQITEMKADYKINESLAYFKNGFGVELPISPSVIDDVRGYINSGKYIKYNQNGTEAGQAKAVIIPFDNQKLIYESKVNYNEPVRVIIEFLSPQPISLLSAAPYNPFLISDSNRSYEVHLPGHFPTNLADKNIFGSFQDLTNPAFGQYYIGTKNRVWALNFAEPFNFPSEGQAIDDKFPRFNEWLMSSGTADLDWYK